jgi:hypothetical protein
MNSVLNSIVSGAVQFVGTVVLWDDTIYPHPSVDGYPDSFLGFFAGAAACAGSDYMGGDSVKVIGDPSGELRRFIPLVAGIAASMFSSWSAMLTRAYTPSVSIIRTVRTAAAFTVALTVDLFFKGYFTQFHHH